MAMYGRAPISHYYTVSGHKGKSSNEGLRTSLKASTRNCTSCIKCVYKHSYTMWERASWGANSLCS